MQFEWSHGRRLEKASNQSYNVSYKYDDGGIRTQKTVNDVTTNFVTNGIQVLAQKTGNNVLIWQIDGNGQTVGFNYNVIEYFYLKNAQGDITGITDSSGNIIAEYVYNSWGKVLNVLDSTGNEITDVNNIAHINPLRYRGYYYDSELGLYYLNARYYDPETGRFLNADDEERLLDEDNDILDYNLFSYCSNNPVNYSDYDGNHPVAVVVVGALIGVLGGGAIGHAIAKHFKLHGWQYWACVGGGGAMLGVVGWYAAPAVYAAVQPIVIQAIAACTAAFNTTHEWALKTLGLSQIWINQALRSIDYRSVKFTNTVLSRLKDSNRAVPIKTLLDCIKTGRATPDPQGVANRIMYYQTMWKNGKSYTLEVLVNWTSKTIEHFLYK